jgi:putative transcriptional regulator
MEMSIQNRVKELRLERGWTQEQLADAVGVSRQSINSIERNRYVPSLVLALSFARIFARSTDDIFKLENPKLENPKLQNHMLENQELESPNPESPKPESQP